MTQSEVINHFAEKFGMKRAQAKELFDELANLAQPKLRQTESLFCRVSANSFFPSAKRAKDVIRPQARRFKYQPKPRSNSASERHEGFGRSQEVDCFQSIRSSIP